MNQSRLKVLAIIPSGFCFGLQHVTVDLFAAARETIDPHFVVTRWSNGDFEKLLEKKSLSYSYSWLGMFSRKLDWYNLRMSIHAFSKLPRLYYDFFKLCRKKKPDILFFANHHELLLLLPCLWFTSRKIVCHMHDPAPSIPFQKMTFKWYGSQVDHFIAISNSVKNRLISLGCPAEKITVIHNGIEIPQKELNPFLSFKQKFNWPEKSIVVGITGQMTQTKGHEDLLKAFTLAHGQNPMLRLVIGGKKLEPLFGILTSEIAHQGLQDSVAFTGWLEHARDFYEAIDIFVLASRHDEGYGLVVAEAMASGKPVIVTNSGGAVEIVENNVNGYIIPKHDYKIMADKILYMASPGLEYNSFSEKAKKHVTQNFNIQIIQKKFSDVLNSFLVDEVR